MLSVTIFNRFFPPQYSGAGQQIKRLSQVFKANNVQVDIITTRFKKNKVVKPGNSLINIHTVYTLSSQNIKKTELLIFSFLQAVWILKNYKKIKTAIFFSIKEENLLPIILLKLFRKKVFIRTSLIGGDDIDTIMKQKFWFLYKFIIKRCDGVICITKKIRRIWDSKLSKLYGKGYPQTYFIPNGIDTSSFNEASNSNYLKELRKKLINVQSENKKIGITVGYFNPRKQINKIIKEWSNLDEEWHLIVLGNYDRNSEQDLDYIKNIKELIKSLNLENRITIDYAKDVKPYLMISDFFVFASKNEGLPNALLEAMSFGLPSLILKQDWVPEELIKHNYTGFIIDSIENLSQDLNELSFDQERFSRIGNMAMQKVQNEYDIKLVSKKFLKLLDIKT
tara:strand:- start:4055 stop:5236 length:1182 start_codon:yes stop_codon:yes gene_type:complete